jgi:hypothetical protein
VALPKQYVTGGPYLISYLLSILSFLWLQIFTHIHPRSDLRAHRLIVLSRQHRHGAH